MSDYRHNSAAGDDAAVAPTTAAPPDLTAAIPGGVSKMTEEPPRPEDVDDGRVDLEGGTDSTAAQGRPPEKEAP